MLTSRKITTYVDNIKDMSDTPSSDGITAPILKAKFDGRTDAEIKNSINGMVDDLTATTDGSSGADQIGATPLKLGGATTVQSQLEELKADKVEINAPITGATKCKVTYDAKGLVTGGADLVKTDLPAEAFLTDDIISEITPASRTSVVPNEKAVYDIMEAIGAGDMTKNVYDPNNKNVDAFNSENHTFDNTDTGIAATNTHDAISEVNTSLSAVDTELDYHTGRAQYSLSATQSSANGAYTNIALDTINKAFDGISTLNSNKAVIQKAGTYAIEAYVNFAANNSGNRFVEVTSNVKTLDAGTTRSTATSFGYRELFTFISDFAVNEQLTLRVYQDSGGALNVTSARLKIKYIGG